MARTFEYKTTFQMFRIEDDGTLTHSWYTPGAKGGWGREPLAGPQSTQVNGTKDKAVAGKNVSILLDYNGSLGRIDASADAATGGYIHAWYNSVTGVWSSEHIA